MLITLTGCAQGQDIMQDLADCEKKAIEQVRSSGGDTESTVSPMLHYLANV